MAKKLSTTALELFPDKHSATKEQSYWEIYDGYFPREDVRFDLVEIGVLTGESLKILASHYRQARILGIDIEQRPIDFSEFPNVTYRECDQSDQEKLRAIVCAFSQAPTIIIDDASHLGGPTLAAFDTLFPLLRNGGLYVIEDWGVGYWKNWQNGSQPEEQPYTYDSTRFPSHDFGLVGVSKVLIDRIGNAIASMHFHQWTIIIRKEHAQGAR
jgi:hypothetical protein